MRPVNLIPPEQRRGASTPLRAGVASYMVVGALTVALAAVVALVLTSNQIADHESEKQQLQTELQQAQSRTNELQAYAQFASLAEARHQTVLSLAQSRFDWERVLRELAIVIPDDVWLTDVSGTASPGVTLDSGADVNGREEILGPALGISGCGASQQAVARFAADLRDIDGVTRVGVEESKLPDADVSTSAAGVSSDNCQTRDFIAQFKILAAFDAVPAPTVAPAAPPAAAATTATPTTDASSTTTTPTSTTATSTGGTG